MDGRKKWIQESLRIGMGLHDLVDSTRHLFGEELKEEGKFPPEDADKNTLVGLLMHLCDDEGGENFAFADVVRAVEEMKRLGYE